ncbi:RNA polymerase sigma factor [Cellulomonas alba]|uniref:Sigma-70 family RNA polymerase sigma factor n=1 Tax=Cellulomonas alba TaxID=3053467 RepID=A0ABT7SE34_9CELL|nr:sigma-70 family RNA polymerase sigma factor [Cellulomonas alba]MDM7854453.1 sigma-70 family RNA polymerase sigma factor [Cellulomonas alba]
MPPNQPDTLEVLARERGRALFGYALLLSGDPRQAEDLVQDAFVRVFARTRTGFAPDAAEAYVRRAILTIHLDVLRRRQRWSGLRHLVQHDERSREATPDPAAAVTAGVDVRAALDRLAPQERVAIVLRHVEDLTVPEVADRMGLATGTVKRYLSTATHKLESLLGPLPDDAGPAVTFGTHPATKPLDTRRSS